MKTNLQKKFLTICALCVFWCSIGACRIENVRTLSGEGLRSEALFFGDQDSPQMGKIQDNLSFAISTRSIEPPQRTSLAGFGGAPRRLMPPNISGAGGFFTYCLPYEKVDLAPRVKVMLWQGDFASTQDLFAILAIDVVAIPADVTKRLIDILQDEFPAYDLSKGNIQVVASHTHAGPAGLTQNSLWAAFACDRYSEELWQFFSGQVVAAFKEAINKQMPVKSIAFSSQNAEDLNRSRMPGIPVDNRLFLLSFADHTNTKSGLTGAPCFATYAIHPTWFGQNQLILSSDIIGHVEEKIRRENNNMDCIVLNGAVGNAEANASGGLDAYAADFTKALQQPSKKTFKSLPAEIEYGGIIVDLPPPKPNLRSCNVPNIDSLISAKIIDNLPSKTKLSYLIFAENAFIFYPGEPIFYIQQELEKEVLKKYPKIKRVQVLGLSNDYLGYFVNENNFNSPTLEACSTLYGKGIGDVLLKSALSMMESYSKQSK